MAATVTVDHRINLGSTETLYTGNIALDNSYPTGGEAIDVSGNERFDYLQASSATGYVLYWDAAAQKLLVFYGDNNNAADGPLIQVPDTTDLSAVTSIKFIAIGN